LTSVKIKGKKSRMRVAIKWKRAGKECKNFLNGLSRKKILRTALKNPGEFVEMLDIVMRRILAVLDFANKALRKFEFFGQILLRYAECLAPFFNPGNDVLINL
jgi:hypothetical protein